MAEKVFEKTKNTPPIESHREGEIIGTHEIVFETPAEKLTLIHEANDRKVFAIGAVRAAEWILGKKSGLYTMAEVLGLPL